MTADGGWNQGGGGRRAGRKYLHRFEHPRSGVGSRHGHGLQVSPSSHTMHPLPIPRIDLLLLDLDSRDAEISTELAEWEIQDEGFAAERGSGWCWTEVGCVSRGELFVGGVPCGARLEMRSWGRCVRLV